MRTVIVVVTLVLSAWGMPWASRTAFGEEKAVVQTKPLLVLTGADSRVEKPSYHRVSTEKALEKLWLRHLGKAEADRFREHLPIVQIDFEKCMVIAIFQGVKTNSRGLNIVSVIENGDNVTLRFDDMSYQTSGGLNGGGVPVKPYAFVVIPKSAKLVVVEEDVQSLKEKPPEWKVRARLKVE